MPGRKRKSDKSRKTKLVASYFFYSDGGFWKIEIIGETKKDGKVRYHYTVPDGPKLREIIRLIDLGRFTYRHWNFIKDKGDLTHQDILGK